LRVRGRLSQQCTQHLSFVLLLQNNLSSANPRSDTNCWCRPPSAVLASSRRCAYSQSRATCPPQARFQHICTVLLQTPRTSISHRHDLHTHVEHDCAFSQLEKNAQSGFCPGFVNLRTRIATDVEAQVFHTAQTKNVNLEPLILRPGGLVPNAPVARLMTCEKTDTNMAAMHPPHGGCQTQEYIPPVASRPIRPTVGP
jgi:hypothetical protein